MFRRDHCWRRYREIPVDGRHCKDGGMKEEIRFNRNSTLIWPVYINISLTSKFHWSSQEWENKLIFMTPPSSLFDVFSFSSISLSSLFPLSISSAEFSELARDESVNSPPSCSSSRTHCAVDGKNEQGEHRRQDSKEKEKAFAFPRSPSSFGSFQF